MFQNLCRRKKQPTTKTKAPNQLPRDLEPPGIFVWAGKVVHDFRHQLNDMLLSQGKDVFFSQREWELREPRQCRYIVSEKRAPLWLNLLETTMFSSGFIFLLNHSPPVSLLLPICPFLFLFFSVPFLSSTLFSLPFFSLISHSFFETLQACRVASVHQKMDQRQGCTCSLFCFHKQIALSCLLFKYQFMLFSQALIQEHYLPATVGYCNAKGYFVQVPPPGFYFDIKKKWTKLHCYHSEK